MCFITVFQTAQSVIQFMCSYLAKMVSNCLCKKPDFLSTAEYAIYSL